jgi:hypothetical protein
MSRPSLSSLHDHPNNIGCGVRIINLIGAIALRCSTKQIIVRSKHNNIFNNVNLLLYNCTLLNIRVLLCFY